MVIWNSVLYLMSSRRRRYTKYTTTTTINKLPFAPWTMSLLNTPWRIFLLSLLLCMLPGAFSSCPPNARNCCNDVENLCDVPVTDVLFGMVHNAMASPSHGFYFFANHINDPIVESLDAGYRGLALDLCNCNGQFVFCHGGSQVGCGVGRRDPVDTFQQIHEWIDDNPNNVVMIWLQINEAAGGSITLTDVYDLVQSVPLSTNTGLAFADRLYQRGLYDDDDHWPYLKELIDKRQQILFFYQGGPDGSEIPPPGIHYFYDYGSSTAWSYASTDELEDYIASGCPIDRGSSYRNDFFMINAFVTAKAFGIQVRPSRRSAEAINNGTFLAPMVEICEQSVGQQASIISVDFWDSGDMTTFLKEHNMNLASFSNDTDVFEASVFAPPETLSELPKGHRSMDHFRDVNFGG